MSKRVEGQRAADTVEVALRRRAALLSELEEVERFLAASQSFGASSLADQPFGEDGHLDLVSLDKAWRGSPTSRDLVHVVELMLRRHGRPLKRREIHRQLLRMGISVPGTDSVRNLGTILWRSGRFEAAGVDGYWFANEERPKPADK